MPVPAFNGKSVDLSPAVHNGGLLYILIVWGVCRLIWFIRKRIDNGKTDDARLS